MALAWLKTILGKHVPELADKGERERVLSRFSVEQQPIAAALYFDHVCPDCHGAKFQRGPQGGLCQNIKCRDCGNEFCVGPFEDHWLGTPFEVSRVERTKEEAEATYGR